MVNDDGEPSGVQSTLLPKMLLASTMIGTRPEIVGVVVAESSSTSPVVGSMIEVLYRRRARPTATVFAVALDDDRCAAAPRTRDRRGTSAVSVGPRSPDDGDARRRSAPGCGSSPQSDAAARCGLGVGVVGAAEPAQPASRRADSAATDRAASGRMRTENLETWKGSLHLFASFLCLALRNGHADTGMESGVPSTGDFRPACPAPTTTPANRRTRPNPRPSPARRMGSPTPSDASDHHAARAPRLPPARRGQGERPEDRAGHLREQPPVVHRLDRDPRRRTPARALPREGELLRGHRARAGPRASSSPPSAPSPCSAAPGRRRSTRSTSSARCSSRAAPSRCTPRARARSTAASTRAARASRSSRCRPARRSSPSASSAPTT